MAGKKMKEKDAIIYSGVLGLVVLFLFLFAMNPFSGFESETVTEGDMQGKSASGTAAAVEVATGPSVTATGPAAFINAGGSTLEERILTPAGFARTEAETDSLTAFLRSYPMKKDGKPVLLYNGKKKENQSAHVAVFKLPLEKEDLQQCADSVMRIYAEYFWKTEQYDRISYRFVDGFQAEYVKWREGYRIQTGSASSWVDSDAYDDSYANFQKYMRMVFAYASTVSMKEESEKIKPDAMQVGDIFLEAGNPGHVVMVVDMCESESGDKAFLLGQGYMPAQEFHLLKNPAHEDDPWYYAGEITYPLETPEYTFKKGALRRLKY